MKNLIILLMAILSLYSCSKEQSTQHSDNEKYQMILNDSNWVEITDTASVNIDCIDFDKIFNYEKFIIRDSIEYNQMYDSIKWNHTSCSSYALPSIDFNSYTLLGCVTETVPNEILKRVFRNDSEKKYLYIISITIISYEKILSIKKNWVLIPKIPVDYSVEIDTTLSYNYR